MEKPKQVPKDEIARNLLKQAADEIRQLRQIAEFQGAQLTIVDKLAKISGWQERPQGASPDLCWEIDRFLRPLNPLDE